MKIEIREMPDKETLEAYIRGNFEKPTVVFDIEKGKFIRDGK